MGWRERLREDIETYLERDPAAGGKAEVVLLYPGLHALWFHRLAHRLYLAGRRFTARAISELARWLTGVEIHPGATIGRRVVIDHGGGVVIGETSWIGDDVLLYQGVTLGGTSQEKTKRHPTIGNGVSIGANATILGPISIGAGARVGAGSVVIHEVPAGATVVGVPGQVVETHHPPVPDLYHADLPDPVARVIGRLVERIEALEAELVASKRDGTGPAADEDREPAPARSGRSRR